VVSLKKRKTDVHEINESGSKGYKMTIRNLIRLFILPVLVVISISGFWGLYMVKVIPAEICGALISGIFLLLTAFLAYKYGIQTYFSQREHEQILARYLERGIDLALTHAYTTENIYLENFFSVNHSFEIKKVIFLADLSSMHKITNLLGDNIATYCLSDLDGFVKAKSDFYNTSFRELIKKAEQIPKEMGNGKARSEIVSHLKEMLNEDFERFRKHMFITDNLQKIASILEKEIELTWAKINNLKSRDDIMQIVELMKEGRKKLKEQRLSDVQEATN
jgi:hypothetical protein